jgi:signal transduction histidine kinase
VNAVLVLEERDQGYVVRVTDDGIGFDVGDLKPIPGHLGLAAMQERASLAGGWLRIDSSPGQGTTVEVWVPKLPEPDPDPSLPPVRAAQTRPEPEAA